MKITNLNQIFLLISLITCGNTLNGMDSPTKTKTSIPLYSLRSRNNKFPYNANANRPKTSPKRNLKTLKRLPLPNNPTKCKNPKNQITQHSKPLSLKSILFTLEEDDTVIDVFSLSTENIALAIDEMDNTIDVFSIIEDSPLTTEYLPLEEHPFCTDIQLFLLNEI